MNFINEYVTESDMNEAAVLKYFNHNLQCVDKTNKCAWFYCECLENKEKSLKIYREKILVIKPCWRCQFKSDYHNGKITIPERNLYLWLRVCINPDGVAIVSLETLAKESFNKPVNKNYIKKLLLSLKSKKYIRYSDRMWHRCSFELYIDDFIRINKDIKTFDKYLEDNHVRSKQFTLVRIITLFRYLQILIIIFHLFIRSQFNNVIETLFLRIE